MLYPRHQWALGERGDKREYDEINNECVEALMITGIMQIWISNGDRHRTESATDMLDNIAQLIKSKQLKKVDILLINYVNTT